MKTSLGRTLGFICFAVVSVAPVSQTGAAEYLGAAAVLEKAMAKKDEPAKKPVSERGKLKKEIADFEKASANMAPETAADTWLSLLERVAKVSSERARNSNAADQLDPQA